MNSRASSSSLRWGLALALTIGILGVLGGYHLRQKQQWEAVLVAQQDSLQHYYEVLEVYQGLMRGDTLWREEWSGGGSAPGPWMETAYRFRDSQRQRRRQLDSLQERDAQRSAALQAVQRQATEYEAEIKARERLVSNLYTHLDQLAASWYQTQTRNETQKEEISRLIDELQSTQETYRNLLYKDPNDQPVIYFGATENEVPQGYGVGMFEKTQGFYLGEWEGGLRHGQGKYRWKNGDIYEGAFVNGKQEGEGVYIFHSGERYEGAWMGGLRNGQGTMYDKEGKVLLSGTWKEDVFQKNKR